VPVQGRPIACGRPGRQHQFLFYRLEEEGRGFIYNAPVEVRMEGADPVQTDLVYLTRDQRALIEDKSIVGAPALLVEILSPSTASRDRTLKLNKYARCGVPEYWIVDPRAKVLEVFRLVDGYYRVDAALAEGDVLESHFGVKVDLEALFAPLSDE